MIRGFLLFLLVVFQALTGHAQRRARRHRNRYTDGDWS